MFSLSQSARYRLVFGSHLYVVLSGNQRFGASSRSGSHHNRSIDGRNANWQSNLTMHHSYTRTGMPITFLEGTIPDQAALHGLLTQIRDLGLPLIAVNCLDFEEEGNV